MPSIGMSSGTSRSSISPLICGETSPGRPEAFGRGDDLDVAEAIGPARCHSQGAADFRVDVRDGEFEIAQSAPVVARTSGTRVDQDPVRTLEGEPQRERLLVGFPAGSRTRPLTLIVTGVIGAGAAGFGAFGGELGPPGQRSSAG